MKKDTRTFLDGLGKGHGEYVPPPVVDPPPNLADEIEFAKNGEPRQVGTTDSLDGRFIRILRRRCERDLYFFARVVLKLDRLVPHLHGEMCRFLTKSPPYRKMVLIPRDCFKTTIGSKALPLHKFIQSADGNIYWPGHSGLEHKILLACEKQSGGEKHILWIQSHLEKNSILRGLWPHLAWENPSRDARAWSKQQFYLPRELAFEQSDPTMQTIGVGGAITGSHVTDIIDDDLVTFEAANSQTVMQTAIDWHIVSRALLEDLDTSHEYIIGTRWAVSDLYGYIQDNDPTVTEYRRSLIEDGKCIFPEEFSPEAVANLQASFGAMFALLYQNDPTDASLVDFNVADLRWYEEHGNTLIFDSSEKDLERFSLLLGEEDAAEKIGGPGRFKEYDSWADVVEAEGGKDAYLRVKYS